jgi:hypothetical protein
MPVARVTAHGAPIRRQRSLLSTTGGTPCGQGSRSPGSFFPSGALPARFHDLRRFCASTLIVANLNPKVIQARLGHATITEAMDTYGHLFPMRKTSARGAIDAVFAVSLTERERNQDVR